MTPRNRLRTAAAITLTVGCAVALGLMPNNDPRPRPPAKGTILTVPTGPPTTLTVTCTTPAGDLFRTGADEADKIGCQ